MAKKKPEQGAFGVAHTAKPHLVATRHPIHFEELSPNNFERMCMWLVKAEGYMDPEHVGLLGSDGGCDIKAWKKTQSGKDLWWFQCKRVVKVNRKQLIEEISKMLTVLRRRLLHPPPTCNL